MLRNIFQIKSWHPLPLKDIPTHMSQQELANMYVQEKDHWWFTAKGRFMKNVLQRIPSPHKVLDAGCGTGHNAGFLQNGSLYIGCDAVFEALQFCRRNERPHLVQSSLTQLGFKDESFDLILCLDVLEHVDDDRQALLELKRLLAQGGTMVLGVPAWRRLYGPHDVSLSHMRRYNPRDLQTLIHDCGLRCERRLFWYALPFFPVYLARWFSKHFIRHENPKSDTHRTPSRLTNAFMSGLLKLEAGLQHQLPMPFGTTFVAVVKRA
jgi:SAM-dependent methyltransferase